MGKGKKYAVVTMADLNVGDFLCNHWLTSLIKNIDLESCDIIVLDYGLTKKQREKLKRKNVLVYPFKKDGYIVNIRLRDLSNLLKKKNYEQILMCDGGDVIFQDNIMDLLSKKSSKFRVVCENVQSPMKNYVFIRDTIPLSIKTDAKKVLHKKKMINAGVIFGPRKKFISLFSKVYKLIKNKNIFGPDQILINYFLYKEGFEELPKKYNFIPATAGSKFYIRKGVFYDKNHKKIVIVHNAGNYSFCRVIKNFGSGNSHNRISRRIYYTMRVFFIIDENLRKYFKY